MAMLNNQMVIELEGPIDFNDLPNITKQKPVIFHSYLENYRAVRKFTNNLISPMICMSQKTGFVLKIHAISCFFFFFSVMILQFFIGQRLLFVSGWLRWWSPQPKHCLSCSAQSVGGQNLKISTTEELRNWWWWNSPGDPRFQPGLDNWWWWIFFWGSEISTRTWHEDRSNYNDGWSTYRGIEHDRTADIFGNRSCWLLVSFVYMILASLWIINARDSKNTSGRILDDLEVPLGGNAPESAMYFGRAFHRFHIPNEVDCVKGLVLWWLKMKEWLSPKNGWCTIHHNTR